MVSKINVTKNEITADSFKSMPGEKPVDIISIKDGDNNITDNVKIEINTVKAISIFLESFLSFKSELLVIIPTLAFL